MRKKKYKREDPARAYRRTEAVLRPIRRRVGRMGLVLQLTAVAVALACFALLLFNMVKGPAAWLDSASALSNTAGETDAANSVRTIRMLEWKEGQFVAAQYGSDTSTELDTSGFTDPATKNSRDLAAWAEMAWKNQWGYVWGTFGYILTEDLLAGKLEQYPETLGEYEDVVREKWMGRRVVDCVGLIKSYGWYDPDTNSIEYASGDMPDVGTDGMWDAAAVRGNMDTMPDEPGILVYSTEGHIGVYVGNGYAVEAISHAGGVVKTMVADRPWTGWLQCPYIRYDP